MNPRALFALACLLTSTALFAGETLRFSQKLTTEQRTTTGVDRLSSDQIAALDALVRLNLNQAAAEAQQAERAHAAAGPEAAPAIPVAPVAFSQALSADQRRAAGLEALSAEQQAALDQLVAAHTPGTPHYEPAAPNAVQAVEFFPNRFEYHGEVGFSIGGGSGYSSHAGWVTTSMLDTKTGTELSVTVAAGREKWKRPYGYRSVYDWDEVSLGLSAPLFRGR